MTRVKSLPFALISQKNKSARGIWIQSFKLKGEIIVKENCDSPTGARAAAKQKVIAQFRRPSCSCVFLFFSGTIKYYPEFKFSHKHAADNTLVASKLLSLQTRNDTCIFINCTDCCWQINQLQSKIFICTTEHDVDCTLLLWKSLIAQTFLCTCN